MATITCRISAELDSRLEEAARRQRVSKSTLVRRAVEASLNGARRKSRPTAYDLAKHLAGSIRGAPGDLATNPKYMEGFGA
jgi:predicted transcriptional regulator